MKEQYADKTDRRDHKSRRKNPTSRNGMNHRRVARSPDLRPMSEKSFLKKLAAFYEANVVKMTRRGCQRGLRDAEDPVHDAFLSVLSRGQFSRRAIQYLPKRHSDRTSGALAGQIRRDCRQETTIDAIADFRGALDRGFENLELRDEVEALFRRLKPSYRVVLELRYIAELSLREISNFTGQKLAAVKSLLHRARQAALKVLLGLRETLGSAGTPSGDNAD